MFLSAVSCVVWTDLAKKSSAVILPLSLWWEREKEMVAGKWQINYLERLFSLTPDALNLALS